METPTWKKNLRNIPDSILLKLKSIKDNIIVSAVKSIPKNDLLQGKYHHLGLTFVNGKPIFKKEILPLKKNGHYSKRNIVGFEVKLKDLPMINKTYSYERPNYGDYDKGTHVISRDRDVYQVKFFPPKQTTLLIEILKYDKKKKLFYFKFTVNEVLNKKSKSFKNELLWNLNILQENIGKCDVYSANAKDSEYLKSVHVDWEILPPGEKDQIISAILKRFRSNSQELRKILEERYDLLVKLKPKAFIQGISGFSRYFGAQFKADLVVFENLQYGNAIYIMFQNWKKISQKSRLELLAGDRKDFIRIVHKEGWQNELKETIVSLR